jgi:hypothetical protein
MKIGIFMHLFIPDPRSPRQRDLAQKLHRAGLLSDSGLRAVLSRS